MRVSSWSTSLAFRIHFNEGRAAYKREIIKDVPLRLIRKYPEGRDSQYTAREQRKQGGYVCDQRKAINCRRFHTAVDQEGVVVADESKTDDADGLKKSRLDDCQS